MFAASFPIAFVAQETSTIPEAGSGAILVWLALGAGIIGLYILINRSRKRSYRDYMSRAEREAEMRANDPDMRSED
jgi:heme exporter protein D